MTKERELLTDQNLLKSYLEKTSAAYGEKSLLRLRNGTRERKNRMLLV